MAVSAEPLHAGAPGAAEPAAGQQGRKRERAPTSGREGPTWLCDLGLVGGPVWASWPRRPAIVGRSMRVRPWATPTATPLGALNLGLSWVTGRASATLSSPQAADPGAAAGGFHDDL